MGDISLGGPGPVLGQLGGPAVDDGEAPIRRVGEHVVDARGGDRVGVGHEDEAVPGPARLSRPRPDDEGRVAGLAGVTEVGGRPGPPRPARSGGSSSPRRGRAVSTH